MRINLGISPAVLADQHLIAEYAEVGMIPGILRKTNSKISCAINNTMLLRFDHTNFFKDKLLYLQLRKEELVKEMLFRNFKVNYPNLSLDGFPENLKNDWTPSIEQSMFVRQRIVERLEEKPDFYRFHGTKIGAQQPQFIKNIWRSELFYV
jgi:deoxyribonuclease (pyrimidine dimer)